MEVGLLLEEESDFYPMNKRLCGLHSLSGCLGEERSLVPAADIQLY
jgi:hypothetical protein